MNATAQTKVKGQKSKVKGGALMTWALVTASAVAFAAGRFHAAHVCHGRHRFRSARD
jgi:hypothetical protein